MTLFRLVTETTGGGVKSEHSPISHKILEQNQLCHHRLLVREATFAHDLRWDFPSQMRRRLRDQDIFQLSKYIDLLSNYVNDVRL